MNFRFVSELSLQQATAKRGSAEKGVRHTRGGAGARSQQRGGERKDLFVAHAWLTLAATRPGPLGQAFPQSARMYSRYATVGYRTEPYCRVLSSNVSRVAVTAVTLSQLPAAPCA